MYTTVIWLLLLSLPVVLTRSSMRGSTDRCETYAVAVLAVSSVLLIKQATLPPSRTQYGAWYDSCTSHRYARVLLVSKSRDDFNLVCRSGYAPIRVPWLHRHAWVSMAGTGPVVSRLTTSSLAFSPDDRREVEPPDAP